MNQDEITASVFAEQLAADQNIKQNDNSIPKALSQSQRNDAINAALNNGSITHEQAEQSYLYYAPQEGVNLIPASCITPASIDWIWKGHLAAGKLHLLAGVPGTGKTTIALDLAATVSLGRPWPDNTECMIGNVLIWSGEDDIKDTLVPRLISAGADRSKIHLIGEVNDDSTESRPFDPAKDMPELLNKTNEIGDIRLIIIDPIIHAVTKDSNKNSDVRNGLKPIVDLASKLNAAVLGITHFSKGTAGKEPLDRVTGSLAFGAVARIVLVTAKEVSPPNSKRYILARAKSNIGLFGGGFYYEIEEYELSNYPGIISSKVKWLGQAEGTVQELLCQSPVNASQLSALEEAKDFLTSLLNDGEMTAEDVYSCTKKAGLSKSTLDRAKKALDIKPNKVGYGKGSKWIWPSSSKIPTPIKDSHTKEVSTFEQVDDLRGQLMRMHPSIIEGCLLKEILVHAEQNDLEDLKDIEALRCFTLYLIEHGKLYRNNDK